MWLAQVSGSPDWPGILASVALVLTALKGWQIGRWLISLRRPRNNNGSYKRLEAENARLAKRNEYLEQRLWRAQEVEAENEKLTESLRKRSRSQRSPSKFGDSHEA